MNKKSNKSNPSKVNITDLALVVSVREYSQKSIGEQMRKFLCNLPWY